jgi:rhamnulokinase
MLGSLAEGKLSLEEIHRFANTPIKEPSLLHWNIPQLFQELKAGLKKAAQRTLPCTSLSTDSWGVDYLLLDEQGEILSPTFHYRDQRFRQGVEKVRQKVSCEALFAETGIQYLPINTIFQLAAETPERLRRAHQILHVADGVNFLLCGVARAEVSNASTSQLYNPRTRTWSKKLIEALDLPARLFPPIAPSGTRLGPLKPEIARETGLAALDVIATCSHDTGSAVAAVPATGQDWAYVSSGTWSLMGVELAEPNLTDRCRELNFTNEIGYGNSVRLLKNIIGLWLVQECRRDWAKAGQEYDYATLTQRATAAPPFVSLINPTDPRFLTPDDMLARIAAFCRETCQPVPTDAGATIRCVLESLALLYARTLQQTEELIGRRIQRLHIVGGGSQNALLNQFTANALRIPVLAGPAEATAVGNVLIQAIASGQLPSLARARDVVRASMPIHTIHPHDADAWSGAYQRFKKFFPPTP